MIGAYFRRGYGKWFLGSGTDEEKKNMNECRVIRDPGKFCRFLLQINGWL